MTATSLVLAAHGSNACPQVNAHIRMLADRLFTTQSFAQVLPAFHQGEPYYSQVLDQLPAGHVIVVPFMASNGYYCDEVLPRELRKNERFDSSTVRIAPPVGASAQMFGLVAQRTQFLIDEHGLRNRKVAIILIGHGTQRNIQSKATTEGVVDYLKTQFPNNEVWSAFIDDDPSVETMLAELSGLDIVAVPFFMGTGHHVTEDIPTQLGFASYNGDHAVCQRDSVRTVILDRPIGQDAGMVVLVESLAKWNDGATVSRARNTVRLGTRSSKMALWQANHVADLLRESCDVEIVEVSTCGDRDLSRAIDQLPAPAPFVDDLETALAENRIDLAVHSLKDLPLDSTPGTVVASILPRADARECLVTCDRVKLSELPNGATVGTSSARRAAQVQRLRPDLQIVPIRGPVDDRIRQVCEGRMDAAVLAVAGLERLGQLDAADEVFDVEAFMPAPGQGALAIQVRADDTHMVGLMANLDDPRTRGATTLELNLLRAFQSVPDVCVSALAQYRDARFTLQARLSHCDSDVHHDATVGGGSADDVLASAIEELNASLPEAKMESVP